MNGAPSQLRVQDSGLQATAGSALVLSFVEHHAALDDPEATLVELEHRKFEQLGAEAGASLRKDVDGGWPGMLEHFKREAESSGT